LNLRAHALAGLAQRTVGLGIDAADAGKSLLSFIARQVLRNIATTQPL